MLSREDLNTEGFAELLEYGEQLRLYDKLQTVYKDPARYIKNLKTAWIVQIPALLKKFHNRFVILLVGKKVAAARNQPAKIESGLSMSWEAASTLIINIVNKIKDEINTIFIDIIPSNIIKSALKSTTLQNCKTSIFGDLTGDI